MSSKSTESTKGKRVSIGIKELSARTKKAAAMAQQTLVKVADKNGDGKVNAEDFGITKENVQDAVQKLKNGASHIGEKISDAKEELDRRALRPVFIDKFALKDFEETMPTSASTTRLIRIVERDKKRAENAVCDGSIGYWTSIKGVELLNIYEDCAAMTDFRFAPNIMQTFYYLDPYKSGVYVGLDSYFAYLKKNRVNELEVIAQELGAKSFRVTFKEHRKVIVKRSADANVKASGRKAGVSRQSAENDYANIEIAAETQFDGQCQPKIPTLVYFRDESDIEKLIRMRMDKNNPIKSKDFRFKCSRNSGMTEKTAAKIDLVLHQLKCDGTATLSSEVQREERTELEYHIEF